MSAPASPTTLAPEVVVDSGVTVIGLGPAYQIVDEHVLDSGLAESLIDIANDADPPLVVLDLCHTQFFGSSFIEVLFRLWTRLQGRSGGAFTLCGLTPHCLDVLKITHLDTLWRLFASREEAVHALSGNKV
ncbi:MAG TPA: STAS domain-containing protein [Planctomycetaceae bacterium]|nr:STAS domain-containing protein [Planctomycetaceae bacterium]